MKNFLIIGGSSGIGQALVQLLADSGNKVFATFKEKAQLEQLENVEFTRFDALQEEINVDFLPDELHGVAYCPGSINLKPFARISTEAFKSDYSLQVLGAISVLQRVAPKLKASGQASVLLFSTVAVQTGFSFHTQVATSKGAIEGLTRSLAAEWAPNVRVNAIAPSLTNTPLAEKILSTDQKKEANAERHPLKRIGEANDIAAAAEFLLSDKASWITGQVIHIDGGMSSIK
jgi:NAD(P)-dependent dehydrogenase (short-subunit alcohol dehydrogenase family)